jgi:hypothetical protein
MATLREYQSERQHARAVLALVVPARARLAAAPAVEIPELYEWISANLQTLALPAHAAPMSPLSVGLR